MTLRKFVYRYIYLNTPGWKLTRLLRLNTSCKKCGDTNWLQLHHINYPFFGLWYSLFFLSFGVWVFHQAGMWLLVALLVIPDLISRMKTLCNRCHWLEEERKKEKWRA